MRSKPILNGPVIANVSGSVGGTLARLWAWQKRSAIQTGPVMSC